MRAMFLGRFFLRAQTDIRLLALEADADVSTSDSALEQPGYF